jgi:hypothetical protein
MQSIMAASRSERRRYPMMQLLLAASLLLLSRCCHGLARDSPRRRPLSVAIQTHLDSINRSSNNHSSSHIVDCNHAAISSKSILVMESNNNKTVISSRQDDDDKSGSARFSSSIMNSFLGHCQHCFSVVSSYLSRQSIIKIARNNRLSPLFASSCEQEEIGNSNGQVLGGGEKKN